MSYQRLTPFATLGRPLEKQALEWGGLGQKMQGWGNQISSNVQGALQSTKANMAGTGALLTGKGYQGAADAANQSWNNSGKNIAATDNRAAAHHATAGAMAEKNQASFARPVNTAIDAAKGMFSGGFNGMANAANDSWNKGTAVINDQQNIIANSQKAIGANSPGAVTPPPVNPPAASPAPPAGGLRNAPRFKRHFQQRDQMRGQRDQMQAAGVTSGTFQGGQLQGPGVVPNEQARMAQQARESMNGSGQAFPTPGAQPAAPTTPQQPPMNQFNQPGGWTTGPNGEIQPMQKQSAFAQLGKRAYTNYQQMGSAVPASTPNTNAAFRKQTGTKFNAKSKMDRQKMQGITKTAFAMLEKEAGKAFRQAAALAAKVMPEASDAAVAISKNTAKSKSRTRFQTAPLPGRVSAAFDDAQRIPALKDRPLPFNMGADVATNPRIPSSIARNANPSISQRYRNLNADNPALGGRLRTGAKIGAGGVALYGAHSMGHNSGRESGVLEGTEKGMELGIQGAQAMQPGDPGFLGRLGDLFTGTQAGPDAATMRQGLNSERDKLVKAILEG